MNSINKEFYSTCKPSSNKLFKIKGEIFSIENFFVDFENAKKFLSNLNIWECDHYDLTTKSGLQSILPSSCGIYLFDLSSLSTYIENFHLEYIDVNFMYYKQKKKFDMVQSSNGTFDLPHHDNIDYPNSPKKYVFLVNLNDCPISTNFWSFNNKELMCDNSYLKFINEVNSLYKQKKENIDVSEHLFMNKSITYQPNQALMYNSSLLHNADIEKKYNLNLPRTTFRMFFTCTNIINFQKERISYC